MHKQYKVHIISQQLHAHYVTYIKLHPNATILQPVPAPACEELVFPTGWIIHIRLCAEPPDQVRQVVSDTTGHLLKVDAAKLASLHLRNTNAYT